MTVTQARITLRQAQGDRFLKALQALLNTAVNGKALSAYELCGIHRVD